MSGERSAHPSPSPPVVLFDDEWEAPQPQRGRVAVVVAACVGIALIVTCVELLTSRERMWEPDDRVGWVPPTEPELVRSRVVPSEPEQIVARATPPPPRPPARRRTGYLSINSSPWAELSVDGRMVGSTPQVRIRVTPGRHHLVLEREGFQTHRAWVNVPAGGTVRLTDITLAEITR